MRQIALSLLLIFSSLTIMAQEELEFFRAQNELIVRQNQNFYWQNGNDLIYMGSLKQIPGNHNIEELESRSELMSHLLNQFLGGVISEAKRANRDSIFSDGFVLDEAVKAVGVQYQKDGPYTVYVGQRLLKVENQQEVSLQSMEDLTDQISLFLNQKSGRELKYTKQEKNNEAIYEITDGQQQFKVRIYSSQDDFTTNLQTFYQRTGSNDFNRFINLICNQKKVSHHWHQSNTLCLHLYVDRNFNLSENELLSFINKSGNPTVTVDTTTVIVDNLTTAKNRGQYQFIADYLHREINYPFENREIIYLNTGDPIFIQDSVLEMYTRNGFKLISDQPIDSRNKFFVLPELVYRESNQLETHIVGPIEIINSNAVAYHLKDEDHYVLATFDNTSASISFHYLVGWSNVEDKSRILELISKNDFPQRNAFQIKEVDNKLLLISHQFDELKVDIWNPETGERKNLAYLSRTLSDVQIEIAISAIIKQYSESPNNAYPVFHEPDAYKNSNSLAYSFPDNPEMIFLAKRLSNTQIRTVIVNGERYHNNWKSFYESLVSSPNFEGENHILQVQNDPVIIDEDFQVWTEFQQSMELILGLPQNQPSFLQEKVILEAIRLYELYQEKPEILHWNVNNEYVALEYVNSGVAGLISGNAKPEKFLAINKMKNHSSNQNLISAILDKCIELNKFDNITILGEPEDEAWLVSIDSTYFIGGQQLNQLFWLGDGFKLVDGNMTPFLVHLASMITNHQITPNIEVLKQEGNNWVYSLKSNHKIVYSFNQIQTPDFKVLIGELSYQKYLEKEEFIPSLRSAFLSSDTILTEIVLDVLISESGNKIALWDDLNFTHHLPVASFPEYNATQRKPLLSKLVTLFKNDSDFSIVPKNNLNSSGAYGLYSADSQTWYYLLNETGASIRTVKNLDHDLSQEILDVFLAEKMPSLSSSYNQRNNTYFFLDDQNNLGRISMINNRLKWHLIGNLSGLGESNLPDLYSDLLEYLSNNLEIASMESFEWLDLTANQVAIWGQSSEKSILVRQKTNGTSKVISSSVYSKYLANRSLLDQYFSETLKMANPENIKTYEGIGYLELYNPESKEWYISNNQSIKSITISSAVHNRLASASSNRKKLVIRSLLKHHTTNPGLQYSSKGFYFYKDNSTVIINHKFAPNKIYCVNITQMKGLISSNIGDDNKLRDIFGTSSKDLIIKKVFECFCIDGNSFSTKFGLQGSQKNIYDPQEC